MKKAVIDVGTNSVRLLMGEVWGEGAFKPVAYRVEITRLGEGMGRGNKLYPQAMERTLKVIKKYLKEVKSHQGEKVWITATSAVREAANKDIFVGMVRRETGLGVKVLSGTQEAELSYKGAINSLPGLKGNPLVFDLGGGSTELIWKEEGQVISRSLKIGVVRLTEAFMPSDPPLPQEIERTRAHILTVIKGLEREIKIPKDKLIGVGGTITTLAAVRLGLEKYDPDQVHGFILHREEMDLLLKKFTSLAEKERKKISGLQPQRADVIVAGTVTIMAIMDALSFKEVTVSEGDILLGTLFYFN